MLSPMFGLSFSHLILLSIIALVVIGPKQLPEVARVIGRFINDLKRTSGEITKSFAEIRDSNNQSMIQQQQQKESAAVSAPFADPIVSHEPSAASVGFDIAPEAAPNRQSIHAQPLGQTAEPTHELSREVAVDERDQLSFDITGEKSKHEH